MANDLQEAGKHFNARNYSACHDSLLKCQQDDPKINDNMALNEYMWHGGDYNESLKTLSCGKLSRLPSSTKGFIFEYEGQEMSMLNQAAFMIHNGDSRGAITLLHRLQLGEKELSPESRVRIALLLRLAGAASEIGGQAMEEIIQLAAASEDRTLARSVQLAFSEKRTLQNLCTESKDSKIDTALNFNNIGVEAFKDGKVQLASLYFTRAISDYTAAMPENPCPFFMDSVMYNAGLCSLSMPDQVQRALECFVQCQRTMRGSPLLWLRIAQACSIIVGNATTSSSLDAYRTAQDRMLEKIGSQSHGRTARPLFEELSVNALNGDATLAQLLEYGVTAANNVVLLLRNREIQNPALLAHAQIYIAYFELLRKNYSIVAKITNEVLGFGFGSSKVPQSAERISNDITLVALSYGVEALCFLNRTSTALKWLQSVSLGELMESDQKQDTQGAQKCNIEPVFVNLCLVHIAAGNFKQAQSVSATILSRLFQSGSSPSPMMTRCATLLQVYLELLQGNKDRAVEYLWKAPADPPPPHQRI